MLQPFLTFILVNLRQMKFLESLVELFYWIVIFLSPSLIFGFIGFVIYYNYKSSLGFTSFIGLSILGVGLGVYFAERIRKTSGCATFMTRVSQWSDSNNDEGKNVIIRVC